MDASLTPFNQVNISPSGRQQSGGYSLISPQFPTTSVKFGNWALNQIGNGASPYNGSAFIPSTGNRTGAGQLSAGLTPIFNQLQDFLTTGNTGGVPGLSTLNEMSKSGMPIDQTESWQKMVDAMQRNIGQGAANLREDYALSGNLASTAFAQGAADYELQARLGQNALLANMQQAASEAAAGRQTQASQLMFQGAMELGNLLQGMDQQSIQTQLQEFIRTQPEYGPLLNLLFGLSTTYPAMYGSGNSKNAVAGGLIDFGTTLLGLIPGL